MSKFISINVTSDIKLGSQIAKIRTQELNIKQLFTVVQQ